jgi:hypothetical protein
MLHQDVKPGNIFLDGFLINKRVAASGWRRWRIKHWEVWGQDLSEGCHE